MRKLLLFGAALALSAATYAQRVGTLAAPPADPNPPIAAWSNAIGPIFEHVDRSQVPSGILEEYGFSFIDWTPYTGQDLTPANHADAARWRRLYGALYRARFGPYAPAMPAPAQVNTALRAYDADSLVELPVLCFRYHAFRSDAVQQNLVHVQNNQIYDVPGRSQSPYEAHTAFMVAPTQNLFATNQLRFVFRQGLFYSNLGQLPTSLQVDFGDGQGYVNAGWDAPLAVTYADTGRYTLRFRLGYADGSQLYSHAPVQVAAVPPAARYTGFADVRQVLTADRTWWAAAGPASATVTIEYNESGPPVLDKPLIVLEGYDVSGIIRSMPDYDYLAFIDDINEARNSPLNNGLDADGYDLVFINFTNGVDYLQNNAYLVQRVIRWVNERKQLAGSTEPNVMLGQSMGGLIARYALRDLEVNGGPAHQVRLLITHDSPHRGANAPLSAQAAVRHLAGIRISSPLPVPGPNNNSFALVDELPELQQAYDLLRAPASQQLLAYGTTGLGASAAAAAVGNTPHDVWQTEYDNLGLPQGMNGLPCRVVATSNGTECARPQPFGPGARLATINGGAEAFRFEWYYALLGSLNVRLLPPALYLSPTRLALLLPLIGAYDATINFRLNALPDQQSQEVYYGYAGIQKRKPILGLIPLSLQLFSKTVNARAEMLPLDSAPGSILGADLARVGIPAGALPPGISFLPGADRFCFVPTPSALGVPLVGTSQILYRSYSPSQRAAYGSPFANVVTAGRENLFHIEYDEHNSRWMLNEVRAAPATFDCQSFCQAAPTISGPPGICPGGSTFTVAGLPPGANVEWSIETPATVSPSGPYTGPAYTITATGSVSGTGIITARVFADCGEIILTLPVQIGPSGINPTVNGDCAGSTITISAGGQNVLGDYRWNINNSGFLPQYNGQAQVQYTLPDDDPTRTQVPVTIEVTDGCNSSPTTLRHTFNISVNYGVGCANQRPAYAVYPNPARDELTIEESQRGAFQATLYDGQGQPRRQQQAPQGRLRLDTSALPAGLYHLQLRRGQRAERRQIQITH
ncbi:T9SS type A sorting domain-containing protein [Hymenobacter gummosus]|uniref:T9SS type A sorting domain-containing protein n=1 Tax=Hymenobacter gummosus TaxID=1776032 RepID=A0A431U4E5_9BACT|nr:T9SS type A sorting domain-containing protein [Hymenobacter gummosus]RTQ50654.1 T9SS type A sorting domain-containing protein [Hymenobacter gummosus]